MRHTITKEVPIEALQPWSKASQLFPRYSEKQVQDLNEFRERHGEDSILPLVVSPDFRIVDGYNRWEAAKARGEKMIPVQVFAYSDETEMEIHAIVLNAKRRHLDTLAGARAAARLEELYRPKQEETKAKLSEAGAKGGKGNKACTPPDVQALRRESSLERAAKEVGVSQSTVRAVKKIDATKDEDLISAMEKKEISIEKAAKLADAPVELRKAALKTELQSSNDRMTKVCNTLRNEGASMLVAGCIDANIRLRRGLTETRLDSLSLDQLRDCASAVMGVYQVLDDIKNEIEKEVKSKCA